jgi:uncharacterized protein
MDHDRMMDRWRQYAERNDDRNFEFLRSLKFDGDERGTDRLAARLHAQAFEIIDCTRCANCCKTMDVYLTEEDVERIARHLNICTEELIANNLQPRGEDEPDQPPYKMNRQPCPFLGDDDHCTIYESRPACCREFPHTDKKGFTERTHAHASNALICPAVFWIIEQMKQKKRPRRR